MFKRLLLCCLFLSFACASYASDLSITAANVKRGGAACKIRDVQFGETVTNGQLVYLSSGKYYLVDNDLDAKDEIAGVVISANSADGYGVIAYEGPVAIGATTTVGLNYMASSTAGGICPDADIASGDYISSLGHSTSSGVIWLSIKNYGIQK